MTIRQHWLHVLSNFPKRHRKTSKWTLLLTSDFHQTTTINELNLSSSRSPAPPLVVRGFQKSLLCSFSKTIGFRPNPEGKMSAIVLDMAEAICCLGSVSKFSSKKGFSGWTLSREKPGKQTCTCTHTYAHTHQQCICECVCSVFSSAAGWDFPAHQLIWAERQLTPDSRQSADGRLKPLAGWAVLRLCPLHWPHCPAHSDCWWWWKRKSYWHWWRKQTSSWGLWGLETEEWRQRTKKTKEDLLKSWKEPSNILWSLHFIF